MSNTLYHYIGMVIAGVIFTVFMFSSMSGDTWKDHRTDLTGVASPDELDEKIDCLSRGGVWDHTACDFDDTPKSEMSECLALFHCNIADKNFLGCINAKKNGETIDDICSNSDILIRNGCVDVTFPDGTHVISCEQEITK